MRIVGDSGWFCVRTSFLFFSFFFFSFSGLVCEQGGGGNRVVAETTTTSCGTVTPPLNTLETAVNTSVLACARPIIQDP